MLSEQIRRGELNSWRISFRVGPSAGLARPASGARTEQARPPNPGPDEGGQGKRKPSLPVWGRNRLNPRAEWTALHARRSSSPVRPSLGQAIKVFVTVQSPCVKEMLEVSVSASDRTDLP